VKNNVSDF